ncbi:MAG: EscU/YscU/HrcU family type III secretion system export apparatus switch protein, partial [Bdellovibrio sp.]
MASEEDSGEKTEEPTQTRREEFRKKGQVAQSKEVASALFVLAFLGLMMVFSKFYFTQISDVFLNAMGGNLVHLVKQGDVVPAVLMAGKAIVLLLLPILGLGLILGIGSSLLQIGFLNVEDALSPKWEKIDPLQGFKRLFSLQNFFEGMKSVLKLVLMGWVVYAVMKSDVHRWPLLSQTDVRQIVEFMGWSTVKMLAAVGAAMTIIAALDFFFQRWNLEKKMMMTKQEIKEEHKSREGDPLIKARIRRVQKDLAKRRMMEKVPTADVIVTNPTHIAVALKYSNDLP